MKKFFTLVIALLGLSAGANATEYNIFPGNDGWFMFNDDDAVSEYVGTINESKYTIETRSGRSKMIQCVYADIMPDYPASEVQTDVVGAGTDANLGGTGALKGALVVAAASARMSTNGGGFIVCLPSCSTFSIMYSSESSVNCRILATTNTDAPMSASSANYDLDSSTGWKVISAKYASVFKSLSKGLNTWSGIEALSNGSDAVTIQSDKPIYVWFQNLTADKIYIHGIKATTTNANDAAGVNDITADEVSGPQYVYTIDGKSTGAVEDLNSLSKGIYIVRQGNKTSKVAIR